MFESEYSSRYKTRYTVRVKVGYDDVSFNFYSYRKALEFADTAMQSVIATEKANGEKHDPEIKITMEPITITPENNEKEEENKEETES